MSVTDEETIRDAQRYRAIRAYAESQGALAPHLWGRVDLSGDALDATADELRKIIQDRAPGLIQ